MYIHECNYNITKALYSTSYITLVMTKPHFSTKLQDCPLSIHITNCKKKKNTEMSTEFLNGVHIHSMKNAKDTR